MRIILFILFIGLASCQSNSQQLDQVYVSGKAQLTEKYLTLGSDTIQIKNGIFLDTITRTKDQYNYLRLDSWKWPKIVYVKKGEQLRLNFKETWIASEDDPFNGFLLNKDSILSPYTAKWNMKDGEFRRAWKKEFPENVNKINAYFADAKIPKFLVDELIQMEYMLRAHLTANFISFQERKGLKINRNIYDFVKEIDLNNERLGFHENNRNFQYYYFLDKMGNQLPDSIYAFAAIDTINKYVKIEEIKKLMIRNVVKSGLYEEDADPNALYEVYKATKKDTSDNDGILALYNQIRKLEPGNIAPEIGTLESLNGDSITMNQLKGKNLLLVAWGTWCPYCKEELPHLKRLMRDYPDQFVPVAISLDTETAIWKKYINENDWGGIHLIDKKRGSPFRANYLISGTNKYYLIDKNGKIITGKLKPSSTALETLIKNLD